MEKRQSIQQVILEIVDSFMKKNQTRILFHIIYKTKFKMNLRFKWKTKGNLTHTQKKNIGSKLFNNSLYWYLFEYVRLGKGDKSKK